jgi:hypothetical protein
MITSSQYDYQCDVYLPTKYHINNVYSNSGHCSPFWGILSLGVFEYIVHFKSDCTGIFLNTSDVCYVCSNIGNIGSDSFCNIFFGMFLWNIIFELSRKNMGLILLCCISCCWYWVGFVLLHSHRVISWFYHYYHVLFTSNFLLFLGVSRWCWT